MEVNKMRSSPGQRTLFKKVKYYACLVVGSGEKLVTSNWEDCKKLVAGKKARYKSFSTKQEAEKWLEAGADYGPSKKVRKQELQPGIYFDAGTGRGKGVEISVTDEKGKDLLKEVLENGSINKFGKHLIKDKKATNNYGELLAAYYALKYALKKKERKIFGDSALIINYWSKGYIKRTLPEETQELVGSVKELREEFEEIGGEMIHVSGDLNPADLGFHK